jgi:hypothetical protein
MLPPDYSKPKVTDEEIEALAAQFAKLTIRDVPAPSQPIPIPQPPRNPQDQL